MLKGPEKYAAILQKKYAGKKIQDSLVCLVKISATGENRIKLGRCSMYMINLF